MSRQEAIQQFRQALKAGQKCYRECVHRGRYPYPQVLEERLREFAMEASRRCEQTVTDCLDEVFRTVIGADIADMQPAVRGGKTAEATAALASLGYSQAEIGAALKGIDVEALRVEDIVRQALRAMVSK